MISLIRFEDFYGMADIFFTAYKHNYLNVGTSCEHIEKINGTTFATIGSGSSWGIITKGIIMDMMNLNIDRIIIVYDMDNTKGIKSKILEKQVLSNNINDIEAEFKKYNYNIDIRYIPTVYAAESIMLNQFLVEDGFHIDNIVSLENTNELHLVLLEYLSGNRYKNMTKRVRNYIDIEKLQSNLKKNLYKGDLNYILKEWIIQGCDLSSSMLMNKTEALNHRDLVEKVFENSKLNMPETFGIDGKEFYLRNLKYMVNNLRV